MRLRCSGICQDNHPIKTEFERLSLHEEKLERFTDWSKSPLRPSTTINSQAATHFIGHKLSCLFVYGINLQIPEQRKCLRDISRADGNRNRFSEDRGVRKKRKGSAALEFLEKAARGFLGSNDSGAKGPLRDDTSDEDDRQTGAEPAMAL